MKRFLLIAGITLFLFIIGLFSSPLVLKLIENVLDTKIYAPSILSSFISQLSFGILLAFCSINAGCLLWAYSRNHSKFPSITVFGFGLFVSLASAMIGIGLNVLQLRDSLPKYPMVGSINWFDWGYGLVLFVNIILIVFLLWLPGQPRHQKDIIAPARQ